MKYEGMLSHKEDKVIKRLETLPKPFSRYHIVKGMFKNAPETKGPDQICFAYIDFDFYESIGDALRFTHDRLSVGGAMIVDDYGFFSAGAQRAVDEFMESRREVYEFRVANPNYGHFCILRRRI